LRFNSAFAPLQELFLKWCLIQEAGCSPRENQPKIWWVMERTWRSNRRYESVAHSSPDGGASVARGPRRKKDVSVLVRKFSKAPGVGRVDLVHAAIPKYDHQGVKYYWKPFEELSSRKSVGTVRYC